MRLITKRRYICVAILLNIIMSLIFIVYNNYCQGRSTCSWPCDYIRISLFEHCKKADSYRSSDLDVHVHSYSKHPSKTKSQVTSLKQLSAVPLMNNSKLNGKQLSQSVGKNGLLNISSHLCCSQSAGKLLEDLCTVDYNRSNRTLFSPRQVDLETKSKTTDVSTEKGYVSDGGCTCEDYMYCSLVAVTGFSSNHFKEAQGMIVSVQEHLPNTKLIVYDLGLTENERSSVIKYCNVELRTLNYSKYPKHVSNVLTYAFKPLIANQVAKEYEVVLWMDSSIRIKAHLPEYLLRYLTKFPFISGPRTRHASVSLTHNGMLEYLNITKSRKVLSSHIAFPGTAFLIWANTFLKQHFLQYWVDCALHVECISPPGAQGGGCNFHKEKDGAFIGCHRFDESALNMIMIREFGLEVGELAYHEEINKVMMIDRSPQLGPSPKACS